MSDYSDLIAQFAAKGGKVKVIAEGESSGITSKEWRNATRGESRIGADAERAFHNAHDAAVEARMNGNRAIGYDSNGNVYTDEGEY